MKTRTINEINFKSTAVSNIVDLYKSMEALIEKWLSSKEIDTVTRIQILNKTF